MLRPMGHLGDQATYCSVERCSAECSQAGWTIAEFYFQRYVAVGVLAAITAGALDKILVAHIAESGKAKAPHGGVLLRMSRLSSRPAGTAFGDYPSNITKINSARARRRQAAPARTPRTRQLGHLSSAAPGR